MQADGLSPRTLYADVEEHVRDNVSGHTRRCDVTLRDFRQPLLTVEMKRPEIATVDDPILTEDAHSKALSRGQPLYATCNFTEVALWRTEDGPQPQRPVARIPLASELRHSSGAPSRRQEIQTAWQGFLDRFEAELEAIEAHYARTVDILPPQVADLQAAVRHVAEETTTRIVAAVMNDPEFHDRVIEAFSEQFGVELYLDPARPEILEAEANQVATIACFVVATRLLLYQALSIGGEAGRRFNLDRLEVHSAATDPTRVAHGLSGFYQHARDRTRDFELQFTASFLDDIAFVPSPTGVVSDVGSRWARLVDVVVRSDWSGPAQYVPNLYESLLDEDHRHLMGVHYTPDVLAEIVAAYAIRDAADVIMDPAAGAGTFATMCYERKRVLGSTHEQALSEVYGVEIADFAASLTGLSLALADADAPSAYPRVVKSDFFGLVPGGASGLVLPGFNDVPIPRDIDAIVGNPPYVRFESRTPEERQTIRDLLLHRYHHEQVAFPDFTGKADLWAFFVAQAHAYLKIGGRLGFVLSWTLLCSNYGDAVLGFLARHFLVDAIIDSRVERFFAAKQHVVLLLARRAPDPAWPPTAAPNSAVDSAHPVRFVRLKRPLASLMQTDARRGARAEDLVDELMSVTTDVDDDLRWDIHVVPQGSLSQREAVEAAVEDPGDEMMETSS
jgi:hypothetical protein